MINTLTMDGIRRATYRLPWTITLVLISNFCLYDLLGATGFVEAAKCEIIFLLQEDASLENVIVIEFFIRVFCVITWICVYLQCGCVSWRTDTLLKGLTKHARV